METADTAHTVVPVKTVDWEAKVAQDSEMAGLPERAETAEVVAPEVVVPAAQVGARTQSTSSMGAALPCSELAI